ncbi:PD-(D/E)XK nuclease-like domain-containing protein, partial [Lactiplantibacillus plantarum]|uniref:PD-(D/E)XK nuclease-like domain-containing protein n=1 Tax=Lactiplantibacillus plantarum TaxID=1590 RepID=UPI000B0E09ED
MNWILNITSSTPVDRDPFLACEAEALAELTGKWQPVRDAKALVVGNWLHSYFESKQAHEKF